jgi:LysM repeat protein
VRAFYQGSPGWISSAAVNMTQNASSLPRIGQDSRSPMQAFYFQTGFGTSDCNEAPSVVAVQGPANLTVDLTVNGADIRLGSLITLQMLSPNTMLLVVLEGRVETADGLILEAGQAVTVELDAEGNIILWGEPRPATPDELQVGNLINRALIEIGNEPAQLVATTCGPDVTHTVAPGENLFRIALRYGTSVAAIQHPPTAARDNRRRGLPSLPRDLAAGRPALRHECFLLGPCIRRNGLPRQHLQPGRGRQPAGSLVRDRRRGDELGGADHQRNGWTGIRLCLGSAGVIQRAGGLYQRAHHHAARGQTLLHRHAAADLNASAKTTRLP